MDRPIVYVGAIPQDTDLLYTNRYTMVALGYLTQALLGTSTLVSGLACTPTSPASMQVQVANGSIYSQESLEATAYGSIAADTSDQIIKQGIVIGTTTFSCPAPTTSGQSVAYLIEATYSDVDGGASVLPYYNSSNPSTAFNGPNNTGVSQNTVRRGVCTLTLRTGAAATTGSQVAPTPDAGAVGLWLITVANGQTTITSSSISQYTGAPFISETLTTKISKAYADTLYQPIGGTGRARLTNSTTYYVGGSGASDSNAGTSGAPWATIQHAIDYIATSVDTAGYAVNIQLADGTYSSANATKPFVGGGIVTIQGDGTTPANTLISATSGSCFSASGNGVEITIKNLAVTNSAGAGFSAGTNSAIHLAGGVVFQACTSGSHINCQDQAFVSLAGTNTITSGASSFCSANINSELTMTGTINLVGTPTFSTFAAVGTNASIVSSATFSGGANGTRYGASLNGVISTNSGGSATYFPGSVAGSVSTGGQYS